MKFFWAVTIVIVLFYNLIQLQAKNGGSSNSKYYLANKAICLQNNSVSTDEYSAARKVKYANATQKIKCYIDCMSNAAGTIKNGVLQDDNAIQYLTPVVRTKSAASAIVTACKPKMTGADNCAKAYNFKMCVESKLPKNANTMTSKS